MRGSDITGRLGHNFLRAFRALEISMTKLAPYLTIREAAEVFRISRATLYAHSQCGRLPLLKFGGRTLIASADLVAMLKGRKCVR